MELKKVTKLDIAHAKLFGIPHAQDSFLALIDRLQVHSEWKHPSRLWTPDTYYGIAFAWMGKEKELEERVLTLEAEMKSGLVKPYN